MADACRRMHNLTCLALGLGQGEEGLPALVAALVAADDGDRGCPPGVESLHT